MGLVSVGAKRLAVCQCKMDKMDQMSVREKVTKGLSGQNGHNVCQSKSNQGTVRTK